MKICILKDSYFAVQESRKPLPGDKMADIWELTKDHGILLGKGGRFGNVSATLLFLICPSFLIRKIEYMNEWMNE